VELVKGILAFLALFAYGLVLMAIWLAPTALNLIVTAIIAYPLFRLTRNFTVVVPVAIIVSFILAMNIRLPGVVSDVLAQIKADRGAETRVSASDKRFIILKHGTPITLKTNIDVLVFKESPSFAMHWGARSLGDRASFIHPTLVSEVVSELITAHGLVIENDLANPVLLDVNAKERNELLYVQLALYQGGELVAEEHFRMRQTHAGDPGLQEFRRSKHGLAGFLTRATLWNIFLRQSGLLSDQRPVVAQFLKDHVKIESAILQEVVIQAQQLENPDLNPLFAIGRGRGGDQVWCDGDDIPRIDSSGSGTVQMINGDVIKAIEHKTRDVEKIVCAAERILLVQTPTLRRQFFRIYEYDYQGKNLGNYRYITPARNWRGYSRRPLIYFQLDDEGILAGVQESGKIQGIPIPTLHFYYRLRREE
jgi:hypothetical protein